MYVCITLLTLPGFAVIFTKANKQQNLTASAISRKRQLSTKKQYNISFKLNQKFNSTLGPVSGPVQKRSSNISLHDFHSKLLK